MYRKVYFLSARVFHVTPSIDYNEVKVNDQWAIRFRSSREHLRIITMPLLDSVRTLVLSPTELKVRQATDESESSGATGTLMNEISVLTYSPKTLKEIVQVVRKRLAAHGRRNTHKNCIHLVKTLTLITYLMNNGSNDFIAWVRGNMPLIDSLRDFEAQDRNDEKIGQQIRAMSQDLYTLIKDDNLLESRRAEVIQFRSSISSPGRKSTDNSHLRKWSSGSRTSADRAKHGLQMSPITPGTTSEFQYTSNTTRYYERGATSLDLKRRFVRGSSTEQTTLDPLHEEDDLQAASVTVKASTNPFR